MPKLPDHKNLTNTPRDDIDEYLHTEKKHKDWYNRKIMGNMGNHRGYLRQEKKKRKAP